MKPRILLSLFFLCGCIYSNAQSKRELIDQLSHEVDSLNTQQQNLVNQIIELNSILIKNNDAYAESLLAKKTLITIQEKKISMLENELDSIKKISTNTILDYTGTYKYESNYAGAEDGAGSFNGNGEVIIENFKQYESFSFTLNVLKDYNGEYVFEGYIKGVAEFRSDNVASFTREDCEQLLFIFTTGRVEIIERNCDYWHGARVSFDNIYFRAH